MTGRLTGADLATKSLQYFIAATLLLTGLGKLLDIPGFIKALADYQALPQWALPVIAVGLTLTELRISEWLFRGKRLVRAALASLALHGAFTFAVVATLLRGIEVPNCGCFGVFFTRPLTGWTALEDLVMVAASYALFRLAKMKPES